MRDELTDLRNEVHAHLLKTLDSASQFDHNAVQSAAEAVAPLLDSATCQRLVQEVLSYVHGLGPLERLIADPAVSDVMVVGGRGVWVERRGVVSTTDIDLAEGEVVRLIERIIAPLGLRVDRASPMVDARLADGSRVNAIVPPLAVEGSCLTIRRFGVRQIALEELAHGDVNRLLREAVQARMNVLVTGGTGSGKTTLLNALARHLDEDERVITIEDAAELQLPLRHVVRLEARPANAEGAGAVSLRELLRNALRMRPDRIIIGEVRGPEALDMLQAMNTGHEGSMSTCHANSCLDALGRIETMVLTGAVALPLDAVRQQIAAAIDLVVRTVRNADGRRCVTEVAEVVFDGARLAVRPLAVGDQVIDRANRLARVG